MIKIPIKHSSKFKVIDSNSLIQLDMSGIGYECFICYGNRIDVTEQKLEHRYRKNNQYEGIVINWDDNTLNLGWEDNYINVS